MRKTAKKISKLPYSILSNYRFIYSSMLKYDKSLLRYGAAEVLFNVLMPFGGVLIPSIVVGLLVRRAPITEFIITLAVIFTIYGIIVGIRFFLNQRNDMQYINIRLDKFWPDIYKKCMDMDYYLMEDEKTRADMEKASRSIYNNNVGIEGFMHYNVSLAYNLLGLILYACVISFVHPLILVLMLVISFLQLLSYQRAKSYEQSKKEEYSRIEVTQRYLQDQAFDLKTGKDVRLYQLDRLIDRVYGRANRQLKKIKAKIRGFYYINDMTGIVLRFLRDGVCYGYLIYLLIEGMEVSQFVLYLGIISGFATWFTKITEDMSEISHCHMMIGDFRYFMDIKNVFRHKEGREIKAADMALDIVFDRVSYCYEGSREEVLKDISFHMKKGERFALVGVNGAGKTTIVKLLCGFYQPAGGRILINGIDTRELNIEKYFEQIAVVFQDPFVLSFTIGENISGSIDSDSDREKLMEAVELSGLKSKTDGLAKGLGTYINKDMEEGGIQLSGGELQKLMLARALYKNAKLLILDEPTAALDAIAESELYEQYQKLLKGRTSLFISHRLASTRFCNHILYLDNGRIAEEGSHEDLMRLNGKYAAMFQVQSKYYQEERSNSYETQATMG